MDPVASGYIITHGDMKPALLRKTSTNSYIFKSENKIAIGYFDTQGNLVIEVYDEKLDIVTIEKYSVIKNKRNWKIDYKKILILLVKWGFFYVSKGNYFIAIAEISTFTFLGKQATWTVSLAGAVASLK